MLDISYTMKTSKLVSVNAMYEPNVIWINSHGQRSQRFLGMRLSSEARLQKEMIHQELTKANLIEHKKDIDWRYPFEISICYVLLSNIGKRDLNNLHKATIDGIFEYFGLNDNRIYAEHYYKIGMKDTSDNYEYIKFSLKQIDKTYEEMSL